MICHTFHHKAGKPKVGLPKARKINETVSLNLKPVATIIGNSNDKKHKNGDEVAFLDEKNNGKVLEK